MNVVNACLLAGVKTLVYTSSSAAIADGKPRKIRDEAAFADVKAKDLKFSSSYGQTKL